MASPRNLVIQFFNYLITMIYDSIIIGGSAAGTAAGIYFARRKINFLMLCKEFGGEVALSGEIKNWPGIIETTGLELSDKFKEHLASYGVEPKEGIFVNKILKKNSLFEIEAAENGFLLTFQTKTVLVTTGSAPRKLNIPGEDKFKNKGVSYCTVCDGPVFSGKNVAIIGGGNSANEAAIMMNAIAKKVYVLTINPEMKGDQVLIDQLKSGKNTELITNAETLEIIGDEFVKGLKYNDKISGKEKTLNIDGIFIHIGMIPNSQFTPKEVNKNQFGEIIVNQKGETNIPGLYAAGDVTDIPYKQISIAVGQGTMAALSIIDYLNRM